ncbi:MAG: hypothetical protein IJP07_01035, partial [Firmicutes bacterium]|nr:hypothetical protein [Bacillota bacterium]
METLPFLKERKRKNFNLWPAALIRSTAQALKFFDPLFFKKVGILPISASGKRSKQDKAAASGPRRRTSGTPHKGREAATPYCAAYF